MMTVKEIKNELLTVKNMQFKVKGYNDQVFRMVCLEDGKNTAVISMYSQMNINKFGPTCMTLYTFDMMGNKTVGKIKFADVTIIGQLEIKEK